MTIKETADRLNRMGTDRLRAVPLRKERQVAIDLRDRNGRWHTVAVGLSPTRAEAFILGFISAEETR